jgi:xanthine dehydrogenase YagR molybdenum-binding subunit
MPNSWPKERRLLGTRVSRLDAPEKATGRAKYSFDKTLPGMLHAAILRSPYPHAKLIGLDTKDAEKMPGAKAVHRVVEPGAELFYAGDEVVGLAADTEEHLADALRAIKVEYQELPFLVTEQDALKEDKKSAPPAGGNRDNVRPGGDGTVGDIETAFKEAAAVIEGQYGAATISHQCLETHGLVAHWEADDKLTVYASTQAVFGTAGELARAFMIPAPNVKCITHYMGGGFGSKFGPDIQGIVAAHLAKKAGAPVKLMLDRAEEITTAGNRPSVYGTVKMAAAKDGTVTGYQVDCYGTPGVGNGGTVNFQLLPYVYPVANVKRKHTIVRLNTGAARAMRAPGHPQNCIMTDCPFDDLAAKLDMDPLQMRLKNLPQNDEKAVASAPTSYNALRNTIYVKEIEIAAKMADWAKKWHPPGKGPEAGPVKHGMGMALHTWGGQGIQNNDVRIIISADGSVLLESSTQDLGTAARTVLAIVAAEVLGLTVSDITVRIGESQFGRSTGSGGSTTTPSIAPAALNAASAARDNLFAALADKLKVEKGDLEIKLGKVGLKSDDKKTWTWKEACAKLGMDTVKGEGNWTQGLSNVGVGGVQIAEVMVDTETGVVRCTHVVAVQDCGLIVNLQGCESQVAGGVIMGVNYALFEERIMDRHTGRQVNPDMEFYKLGGIQDMPRIDVHMYDMPERGVIGIGEPPTISTCAAIGNAVFNAIGARVAYAPYTPERVLEALAGKEGKK